MQESKEEDGVMRDRGGVEEGTVMGGMGAEGTWTKGVGMQVIKTVCMHTHTHTYTKTLTTR